MNPWQLTDSQARLHQGNLQAHVELLSPAQGLCNLSWNGNPFPGNLLGVTVAEKSAVGTTLSTAGMDRFVRGVDLVANYPQTETQRFTLHVYWRVIAAEASLVILDSIVSLQTSLLECFPKVILTTKLPARKALLIAGDGSPPTSIHERLEGHETAGVLLRDADQAWSYLEMTHPADLGRWRVEPGDSISIHRELGGEFQEKGVIRRLRTRGAFFPCSHDLESDLEMAVRLLGEFAASSPPLTA